jgi:multiple antibiotic resistance protein
MQFTISEMLVILFVVGGPTKAAAYFLASCGKMTISERRMVVVKAVITQAAVLGLFAFFGPEILGFFHVSIGAVEIAGGLILLIFAIGLVLAESGGHGEEDVTGDVAFYPIAVPFLAAPQAIVAIIILFGKAPDMAAKTNGYIALAILLVINLVALFGLAQVMGKGGADANKGSGIAQVLLRVVAIMLSALAVELIVMGLRDYGIMPAVVGGLH